jgi:hypothetical protein
MIKGVRAAGFLIVYAAGLVWFFDGAYADWLRFSSPRFPNPMTGQTIFEKAAKGVFYVTSTQHWWIDTMVLPIWLCGAIGFGLVFLTIDRAKLQQQQAGLLQALRTGDWSARLIACAGLVWFATMMALQFFGDQVMALIFTGSLTVPPSH